MQRFEGDELAGISTCQTHFDFSTTKHPIAGGTPRALCLFGGSMAGVRRHEDLNVWKLSEEVVTRVRRILYSPGVRSDLELRGQLNRAAERIGPNIAEGFARFLPRDNARFIRIAKSSLTEVIVHLERSVAKGYLKPDDIAVTCRFARRARGAATHYIRYLETAKPPQTPDPRESSESPSPEMPDDGDAM